MSDSRTAWYDRYEDHKALCARFGEKPVAGAYWDHIDDEQEKRLQAREAADQEFAASQCER